MLTSLLIFTASSALAAGQVAAPTPAPSAAARGLKDLPNTTIEYYDVTGRDGRSIERSIAKQRPKQPGSKQPADAASEWNLDATFKQRTADGKCTISDATLTFSAKAVLPRLTDEQSVAAPVLAEWKTYVGGLETTAASNLWFVYDRIGTIKNAIVGSSCDGANDAGMKAIDQLKKEEAEFQRKNASAKPKRKLSAESPRSADSVKSESSY